MRQHLNKPNKNLPISNVNHQGTKNSCGFLPALVCQYRVYCQLDHVSRLTILSSVVGVAKENTQDRDCVKSHRSLHNSPNSQFSQFSQPHKTHPPCLPSLSSHNVNKQKEEGSFFRFYTFPPYFSASTFPYAQRR